MNKYKIVLVLLIMFICTTKVIAVCNDKELVDKAQKIEVKFVEDNDKEVIEKGEDGNNYTIIESRKYAYLLDFGNNPGIKITVYDPIRNEKIDATYDYTNNTQTVGSFINYSAKNYEIYIYSDTKNSCYGELLRKIEYTVPAFNEFSLSEFCENNKDVKECKINYDSSKLTNDDYKKIIEEVESKEATTSEKTINNLKKYWYFIFIPAVIISIYYIIKILAYKKKVNKI